MKRYGWKRSFALMLALFASMWGPALAEADVQAEVPAEYIAPAPSAAEPAEVLAAEETAAPAAEAEPEASEPEASEPAEDAGADVQACAHSNYSVHTRRQNLRAESLDAGHHSVDYTLVTAYTCRDCGLSWQEVAEYANVTEPHKLVDGVCAQCGYRAGCTHENAYTQTQRREVCYSDINGSGHSCSYYAVTVHICPDCGAEWEDAWPQKRTSQRESHKFENGECTLCGYENSCTHSNALERAVRYELSYGDADAEGHVLSYYAVTAHECPDCGKYWEDAWPVERTREWEAHCFEDGVCALCGYENTCAHQHVSTYLEWRDPQYSDPDAGGHTLSYLAVSVTLCSDCTERWEAVPAVRTTVRQAHSFVDGVCQECGYSLSEAPQE